MDDSRVMLWLCPVSTGWRMFPRRVVFYREGVRCADWCCHFKAIFSPLQLHRRRRGEVISTSSSALSIALLVGGSWSSSWCGRGWIAQKAPIPYHRDLPPQVEITPSTFPASSRALASRRHPARQSQQPEALTSKQKMFPHSHHHSPPPPYGVVQVHDVDVGGVVLR